MMNGHGMNGVAAEVRAIDRQLADIGRLAASQRSDRATEIVADSHRVLGRLRASPTCDDVNDLIDRLRGFEHLEDRHGGPAKAMRLAADLAVASAKAMFERLAEHEAEPAPEPTFTLLRDIKPNLTNNDIVRDLIPSRAFGECHADAGGGKTAILVDLMLHIAAGRDYRGRRVEQQPVVYVALEGHAGIDNRVVAARRAGHRRCAVRLDEGD
jgi:hypothetical protein